MRICSHVKHQRVPIDLITKPKQQNYKEKTNNKRAQQNYLAGLTRLEDSVETIFGMHERSGFDVAEGHPIAESTKLHKLHSLAWRSRRSEHQRQRVSSSRRRTHSIETKPKKLSLTTREKSCNHCKLLHRHYRPRRRWKDWP